jgi:peptidoglycan/xylan/chitin deacetylase (PgdA/CDA1 family)
MIGNVFVISDWIGKENKWEDFGKAPTVTMTEKELLEWQNTGNYIGSHTVSHPFLSTCTNQQITQELLQSKKSLDLLFRGSSNQRIIDVPKSLENHKVVLLELKDTKQDKKKRENIYI